MLTLSNLWVRLTGRPILRLLPLIDEEGDLLPLSADFEEALGIENFAYWSWRAKKVDGRRVLVEAYYTANDRLIAYCVA